MVRVGWASRALLLSFFAIVCSTSATGHASEGAPPPLAPPAPGRAERGAKDDALARAEHEAHRLDLARNPGWLRLLHYRETTFGREESDLEDPHFFLTPNGAVDPEAELLTSLQEMSRPPNGDEHARCRFPARFAWLAERLSLPRGPLECPRLDAYLSRTAPRALSFVYASNSFAYPASAIGHSFLLLEGQPRALSIDYRAAADTGNPLLYAFKGLTGLFVGHFELEDGEATLRNFLEAQDRDLWKLELELSPDELRLFTLHLWELSQTETPYYYLSGNCSYHALASLEAVAPRLRLVERTKAVVIPIDTVRAVLAQSGLTRRVSYLPSRSSRELAAKDGAPTPPPLTERPATSLHDLRQSHGPLRLHGGSGWSSERGALFNLGFRFTLHELLDPPAGYPELLQIQLLGVSARYALSPSSFTIDRVSFFDLWALRPLDTDAPLSWRIRAFGDRARDGGCPSGDCFIHGLELGAGLTWATTDRSLALFALALGSTTFSGAIDGVEGSFVRLGVGPHLGMRLRLGHRVSALLGFQWMYLPWQTVSSTFDGRAELRFGLARDVAVGLEVRAQPSASESSLSSYFYF